MKTYDKISDIADVIKIKEVKIIDVKIIIQALLILKNDFTKDNLKIFFFVIGLKEISIGLLTTNKRVIDDHYELFDSYGVTTAPTITFSHGTNILKCCAVEVDTPKREPSKVNASFRRSVNKPNTIKLKESFHDQLLKLIIESGKDNADIYKDSGITRQVFSKIMCTPTLIPKKETIICLCIGLELSLNRSLELLNAAGYTLSESIMLDSIVMKYLDDEIYDLDFINSELDEFNCPLLGWHPRDD